MISVIKCPKFLVTGGVARWRCREPYSPQDKEKSQSHPFYTAPALENTLSSGKQGGWRGLTKQRIVSWVKAKRVGGCLPAVAELKIEGFAYALTQKIWIHEKKAFSTVQTEKFWKKGLTPNIFLSLVCQKGSGKCLKKNSSCLHIFTNLFWETASSGCQLGCAWHLRRFTGKYNMFLLL